MELHLFDFIDYILVTFPIKVVTKFLFPSLIGCN
jgi:hypothetical protein